MLFVNRDGNAIYGFQKERKMCIVHCTEMFGLEINVKKATTLKSPTLVLKRIVVRSLKTTEKSTSQCPLSRPLSIDPKNSIQKVCLPFIDIAGPNYFHSISKISICVLNYLTYLQTTIMGDIPNLLIGPSYTPLIYNQPPLLREHLI